LTALTRPGTGTTGEQCQSDGMAGARGGRELMTRQAAELRSSSWSWPSDLGRKVPANMSSYHSGLAFLSLRGARFLASPRNGLRNLGGTPGEIATPRQAGARNDTSAWCWTKEAATGSWRRDLNLQVSSLFLGTDEQDDYFCPRSALHREGAGRSWAMYNTSNVILQV